MCTNNKLAVYCKTQVLVCILLMQDGHQKEQKSALENTGDRYVCGALNIHIVARLSSTFYFWVYLHLFAVDNCATSFEFRIFNVCFCLCGICETDNKSAQVNVDISRKKIREYLDKHARSPWWISNARLADFCGIRHDDKVHNTTILGKYLPRGQSFWERSPGQACTDVK